ncbi:MAG: hypothetical protein ACREYE_05690 [Gammaproteobacteria bacterium]
MDEGYKTLAARNLFLFGVDKWHPADTYSGWLKASPLTQWSYYAAFLISKPDIAAARTVTIVYYALFLLLYFLLLYDRYSPPIFYAGLFLFSLESTLYFFSRIALFEIPMATFVYALVMLFTRVPETKSHRAFFYALAAAAILTFSIKASALVYMSPVFLSIFISLLFQHNLVMSGRLASYLIASTVGIVILLSLTYSTWSARLDLAPYGYLSRLMERSPSHTVIPPFFHAPYAYLIRLMDNPLLKVSPFVVLAGLFCAAHGVLYQPAHYLKNLYRLTLMCLVIIAPIVLALFAQHPLRYYVPFLPAYILLSIEWLSLRKEPSDLTRPNLVSTTLGAFLLMLFTSHCAVALGVEEKINIMRISNVLSLGVAAVCIVVSLWVFRRRVFSKTGSLAIVLSLLVLGLTQSLVRIGDFLANPTYGAEQVRHELMKSVNSHQIIAGNWAPFFALGTPIRALYMSPEFNPPDAIFQIEPKYFLYSGTSQSRAAQTALRRHHGISLAPPRTLGTYNEREITLYPLSYSR